MYFYLSISLFDNLINSFRKKINYYLQRNHALMVTKSGKISCYSKANFRHFILQSSQLISICLSLVESTCSKQWPLILGQKNTHTFSSSLKLVKIYERPKSLIYRLFISIFLSPRQLYAVAFNIWLSHHSQAVNLSNYFIFFITYCIIREH